MSSSYFTLLPLLISITWKKVLTAFMINRLFYKKKHHELYWFQALTQLNIVGAPGPAFDNLEKSDDWLSNYMNLGLNEWDTYFKIMPRVCSNWSSAQGWEYSFIQRSMWMVMILGVFGLSLNRWSHCCNLHRYHMLQIYTDYEID